MIIGIDPGKKGGLCAMSEEGRVVDACPMPDEHAVADYLKQWLGYDGIRRVYLECQTARPGQGVVSMFNFGVHYGTIQGLLIALRIPYELVRPVKWQQVAHHGLPKKKKENPKSVSLRAIRQLYPDLNLIPKGCRKPHDGLIDAVLIAHYGLRQ